VTVVVPGVPGPKLPTRCAGPFSPGLYHAFELDGCRRVVPPCTRSSRGVTARPVSNPVSIGGSGPVRSRTPSALRSSATRGRIGRPGTARPIKALTPCMPCSFGLLPNPRSMVGAQPDGPLEVTVTDRSIRLVTAACGTRMARPVRTTIISTWRRRLPPRGRVRPVLGDPPPRWQEPGGLAAARWGDSKPAPTESVGKTRKNAAGQCRDDDMAP
jgi:hypothetical protein